MMKLYYPEVLIDLNDIDMKVGDEIVQFNKSEDGSDDDLGDYLMPIYLDKGKAQKHHPGVKISTIMFGISDN